MKILFRRSQTSGRIGKVKFKLWGRVELDEDETEIVRRYGFDSAVLIEEIQPTLIRNSVLVGGGVFAVLLGFLLTQMSVGGAFLLALFIGAGAGYFYFHQKRETIFVSDLIHGRYFTCGSVIELARKEAWLGVVISFLRQVMESAKHWDGTDVLDVAALPKNEAKLVMLKGL